MRGEEKVFKVKFSSDGIERLRNEVTEKLKEFMGDYTDDTLVEYVIVLLRNGRSKDEARNELNVFLGDEDSSSFVTWLWDHLSENLNLYVQSHDSGLNEEEEAKKKSLQRDLRTSQDLQNPEHVLRKNEISQIGDKITENKHPKRAVKTSHLRSEIGQTHFEDTSQHGEDQTKRPLSPRHSGHRKRNRLDDKHHSERRTGSLTALNPSSRLLQSAVREAVGTAGVTNKTTEPNSKRLRSVVAASSVEDSRRRLRSMATVSSIAGVALKAAAEAAEDVLRVRPSGNVFDRLGRGVDVIEEINRTTDLAYDGANDDRGVDDKIVVQPQSYAVYTDSRRYASQLVDDENELTIDMDQDGIDEVPAMGYRNSSLAQTSPLIQMDDDSATQRYGNPVTSYKLKRKYQNQPAAVLVPSYDEYINTHATANIWRPPSYKSNKEILSNSVRSIQGSDAEDGIAALRRLKEKTNGVVGAASRVMQRSDPGDEASGVQLLKKNTDGVVGIENGKSAFFQKPELHKTPSRATGSAENAAFLEDPDARTIFVSNVHFAATKDTLSRHFNKFGQVLRVTILADHATGQPKGSAYVEFMKKESAREAISLDGTSFMSRIIKVCMKAPAQPEPTTPTTTPRPRAVPRGSPYPAPRFPRTPFPRGNPNSFRGRGIHRPGARSLQWKRDSQPTPTSSDSAGAPIAPPVRSLTYIRPELKAQGPSN